MGSAVSLRTDFDGEKLRLLARQTKDANQGRIPEHPAGHSDIIRPPKPGYPATLVWRLRGLMIWLSGLGAFVTCSEFGFPHALAVEFDAVGIVDEAIENGISVSVVR